MPRRLLSPAIYRNDSHFILNRQILLNFAILLPVKHQVKEEFFRCEQSHCLLTCWSNVLSKHELQWRVQLTWSSMMMLQEAVQGDVKKSGWSGERRGVCAIKMSQPLNISGSLYSFSTPKYVNFFCVTPVMQGRLGFTRSFPGPRGMNVPSICIAFLSWKSSTWILYSGPKCLLIHSIPKSFVTWLLWTKISLPILVNSAASKTGSNSVVTKAFVEPAWYSDSGTYSSSDIWGLGAAVHLAPAWKYSLMSFLKGLYSKNLDLHAIGASIISFPTTIKTSLGIAAYNPFLHCKIQTKIGTWWSLHDKEDVHFQQFKIRSLKWHRSAKIISDTARWAKLEITLKSGVSYPWEKSPGPTSGLRTFTPSASKILAKLSNSPAAGNITIQSVRTNLASQIEGNDVDYTFRHEICREWLTSLSLIHIPPLLWPDGFSWDMPFWNCWTFHPTNDDLLLIKGRVHKWLVVSFCRHRRE